MKIEVAPIGSRYKPVTKGRFRIKVNYDFNADGKSPDEFIVRSFNPQCNNTLTLDTGGRPKQIIFVKSVIIFKR